MYCRQCGKELPDGAQFCPYCGAASNAENAGGQNAARQNGSDNGYAAPPYPPYPPRPYPNPQDIYSGGWIALGFFFPLVGLILYLVWQTELPNRARACGKGAYRRHRVCGSCRADGYTHGRHHCHCGVGGAVLLSFCSLIGGDK